MMHVCLLITNKTYDFDHSRHNQCIADQCTDNAQA